MKPKMLANRVTYNGGGWAPEYSYTNKKAYNKVREVLWEAPRIEVKDGWWYPDFGVKEIIIEHGGETTERRWYWCSGPEVEVREEGDYFDMAKNVKEWLK